jgi:hypothetical protein
MEAPRKRKLALITGASSGIGEACAVAFGERGYDLLLLARRRERLESLAKRIQEPRAATHPDATVRCFGMDLRDSAAVRAWAEQEGEALGGLDVVINNAGLALGLEPAQEARLDDWDAMIDTNLRASLLVLRLCLPGLIRNRGHLIQLGSVAARWPYARGHVYCATKAAMHALCQALRHDLLGTGARVTEISPGMVETEFSEVRLGDSERARAVYRGMTPLIAQDIAECVLWTAERPARVNIQELVVYPTDQAAPGVVHRRES